jgi:hypothetical protein
MRSSCVNGHLFTPENTKLVRGYRECRACRAAVMRSLARKRRSAP